MTPTFVVSLARAHDRRAAVCKHLQELGITFRLIDAVDGRALPANEVATMVEPGQTMHPGAIGCYLSHLEIYRQVLAEQIPLALILEDDARLSPRCVNFLQTVKPTSAFDYCFLDSDDHNDRGPIFFDPDDATELAPGYCAYRLSAGPHTTHAYMITLECARKRLAHAFPLRKPIDLYDHLPYPIVFRAIVTPKLAWVSEHSLVSFTSQKDVSTRSLSFSWLRKYPIFYKLRDFLRLRHWRQRRVAQRLVAEGVLPSGHRWTALPQGRDVLR